jgi:hypothetical protein
VGSGVDFLSEKGVSEGGTANCKGPMEMNKLLPGGGNKILRATGPSLGESMPLDSCIVASLAICGISSCL